MSRQLRYEQIDQQWTDVPMPDAEAGWQKMKELLDKEDEGRRLLPPMSLMGCFGWSLLLVAAIALTWMVIKSNKGNNSDRKEKQVSALTQKQPAPTPQAHIVVRGSNSIRTERINQVVNNHELQNVGLIHRSQSYVPKAVAAIKTGEPVLNKEVAANKSSLLQPVGKAVDSMKKDENTGKQKSDSIVVSNKQSNDKVSDSSAGSHPLQATIPQKKQVLRKGFVLSAGIGEQQLIPIDGQTAVPYSYYGRKGSFRDYIPSVYLQLQKEKKWNVQAEFRYGAPQSVKEFSYNRRTTLDSMGINLTTTTLRLKKTYYHQLPLSFNYYITPALSVGVGGTYSRFFGAVTEQEVKTQNLQTQAETVYTKIIPIDHYTDSFLYKTQVHYLVQADYQWKRFSFGFRYTRDLQPYIKFITPDGLVEEEKNQSLQFIARFRIWQGKGMGRVMNDE